MNSAVGDVQGISLPAVLNEVISVTGVYSFPFTSTPSTSPVDTPTGVIPKPAGPILLFGSSLTIGGTATSTSSRRHRRHRRRDHHRLNTNAKLLAAADLQYLGRPHPRRRQPQRHDRLRRTGLQRADVQPDLRPVGHELHHHRHRRRRQRARPRHHDRGGSSPTRSPSPRSGPRCPRRS